MAMTGPTSASHHDGIGIDSETQVTAQVTASQKTFDGAEIYETDEREDGSGSSQAQTQTTDTQVVLDSEAQAHARLGRVGREAHPDRYEQIRENLPRDGGSPAGDSHQGPPEVRMIGDFDDSANALWTLYGKEAKSHDEACIETLKDDMDGVLIFAGLFSATLTSFLIDTKQNLQASPADQAVYYLEQNVVMLSQISRQLASIAPQVVIPSDPPSPYPTFYPPSSAIRVNSFWFVALVFGLSAALLAILVQQWVRGYMHVFQRYSHPLKNARLRQYLHDGSYGWYMPVMAEAVPGLVHVSLFLFFVGLGDFALGIDTTVGIYTLIPITICGLIYFFSMFAPVIYPQSPYQNSFSAFIWYLTQKIRGRRYKDRASSGVLKPVSSNMANGQMQLAMEETEKRKGRDERAIRWLVNNLTEDAEMESFAMAIPGSFHTEWGIEVWKSVAEVKGDNEDRNPSAMKLPTATNLPVPVAYIDSPSSRTSTHRSLLNSIARLTRIHTLNRFPTDMETHQMVLDPSHTRSASAFAPTQGENILHEVSSRVRHLLETCNNHGLFANEESWRRRTRASVETVASLVFYANAEPSWFGDICKQLGEIGQVEKMWESTPARSDQLFVVRWTCLSILAIRRTLNGEWLTMHATWAVMSFALLQSEDGTVDERALRSVQKIDESFGKAWKCLRELYVALFYPRGKNPTEEQVKEILRNHVYQIAELERIKVEADRMQDVNISDLQHGMDRATHKLTGQLPGVQFDVPRAEPVPLGQALEVFSASVKPQLILPRQRLQSLCSVGPKLRDIIEGRNSEPCNVTIGCVKALEKVPTRSKLAEHLMERQLWRLHDLRHGSGLGFSVEVFFLALRQLLPISSSKEPYIALFIGTFRAIISGWEKYKYSFGTQQVLLNLVCDLATQDRGIFSGYAYPPYITDELLVLLGNMLEGEEGSHIDKAARELRAARLWLHGERQKFLDKVLEVITRPKPLAPVRETPEPLTS